MYIIIVGCATSCSCQDNWTAGGWENTAANTGVFYSVTFLAPCLVYGYWGALTGVHLTRQYNQISHTEKMSSLELLKQTPSSSNFRLSSRTSKEEEEKDIF